MRVAITCLQLQRDIDAWRDRFDSEGLEVVLPKVDGQRLAGRELISALGDVVGVIAGDDLFDRVVLMALPRLKVISKWGVGVDGIDQAAALEQRIVVTNTPAMFADEVADVAYGYLILLARSLHVIDREVRAGHWPKPMGISLAGHTLGVVGLGSIGSEISRRGLVSKMRVLGVDPGAVAQERSRELGVEVVDLAEMLPVADFIVLSCALTAETRHLLGEAEFRRVMPGARLVNVARGGLIDEGALLGALADGRIGGAALDVMEHEPIQPQNGLLMFPQVILGSHNASNTREACERVHQRSIRNLVEGLRRQ